MQRETLAQTGPVLATSLWASLYVVADTGTKAVSPGTLTALGLAVGSATVICFAWKLSPSRDFGRDDYRTFAFLSVFVSVTVVAQLIGTDRTNGAQTALLTVLSSVFAVPLATNFAGDEFGPV